MFIYLHLIDKNGQYLLHFVALYERERTYQGIEQNMLLGLR